VCVYAYCLCGIDRSKTSSKTMSISDNLHESQVTCKGDSDCKKSRIPVPACVQPRKKENPPNQVNLLDQSSSERNDIDHQID